MISTSGCLKQRKFKLFRCMLDSNDFDDVTNESIRTCKLPLVLNDIRRHLPEANNRKIFENSYSLLSNIIRVKHYQRVLCVLVAGAAGTYGCLSSLHAFWSGSVSVRKVNQLVCAMGWEHIALNVTHTHTRPYIESIFAILRWP